MTIKHLNNTVTSTDADLVQTMDKIKHETGDLFDVRTLEQAILYASRITAVHVGETLLKQNALLLPDVYEFFQHKLHEISQLRKINIENSFANSNWFRSQLSSLLEHHMAYQCPVKRNGTVLYRYGGNLMHALSFSLSAARRHKHNDNKSDAKSDGTIQCDEKLVSNAEESDSRIWLHVINSTGQKN